MTENQRESGKKRKLRAQDAISQIFKIIVICLIVGLFLSWLDIQAITTLKALSTFLHKIVDIGVAAVAWALPYVLMGAIIVVPIYLIRLLLNFLRR